MPANKIQQGESMAKSFPKINQAIQDSFDAVAKASRADQNSNDALIKAKRAETNVNSIRAEFNAVVERETDSDAMSRQAAVNTKGEDKGNLKARLDEEYNLFTTHLTEITKILKYRGLQSTYYSNVFQKLRLGESIDITCRGDSTTYGMDSSSIDRRPAPNSTTDNGVRHTQPIAGKTYPEALSQFLNSVFDQQIGVLNQGYSGDGVKQGYEHWNLPHTGDITIICYGTNDSRETGTGYPGNIEEFLNWYRKMIERELDWGKAIIILTPPRNRFDIRPNLYETPLVNLGEEYGIPVIKSEEMLANYKADIYSDGTHLNSKGYTIWASRISTLFIGKGAKTPLKVGNGSTVLSREYQDNILYTNGAYMRNTAGYATPNEVYDGQGIAAFLGPDQKVTWSFYLEHDDTVILPTMYIAEDEGKVRFTVDFGTQQADVDIDYTYGYGAVNHHIFPDSIVEWIAPNDMNLGATVFTPSEFLENQKKIIIPGKGWHTITAEFIGTTSAAIHGLSFFSYFDLMKIVRNEELGENLNNRKGFLKLKTHNTYSDTNPVSSSKIKLQSLINALGYPTPTSYWENPPIKITVYNWDHNVLEYVITVGNRPEGTKFSVGLDVRETKLISNPNETYVRKLSSVNFNPETDELTLNWTGATNRATEFLISVL